MKAFKKTASTFAAITLLATSLETSARPVDPTGTVAESRLETSPQAPKSTWTEVKTTVNRWLDQAKSNWLKPNQPTAANRNVNKAPASVAKPVVDPVQQLAQQLPDYKTKDKGVTPAQLKEAQAKISQGGMSVVAPGKKADPSLPKNKLGIPQVSTFDEKTVKSKDGGQKVIQVAKERIPLLNIGTEDKLGLSELLLPNFKLAKVPEKKAQPLATPTTLADSELKKLLGEFPVAKIDEAKDPRKEAKMKSELVTQQMIDAIQVAMKPDQPVTEKPYQEFSEDDLKMLAAVMLYQNGKNCPTVIGLFYQLKDQPEKKKEAHYYIGACAHQMKLYSVSFKYLSEIIKEESPQYADKAMKLLSENLPKDYEADFAKLVLGLNNKSLITQEIQDSVYYRVAKGAYDSKDYKSAKTYAGQVSNKSKFGLDALYVSAIASYALGQLESAESQLEKLYQMAVTNKEANKNILSLTSVNLARIQFMRERYKEAIVNFQKVDKSHSLWVRALQDQGWAQIMLGDAAGAIGNMYSLHSPYFKSVYKPESYVVRTIGYLNICQYGDAYQTLSMLEQDYRPWQAKVSQYIQSNPDKSNYYATVRKYLSGRSDQEVDGLPYQMIREMARHRTYLNAQTSINEKIDESGRYPGVVTKIGEAKANYQWRKAKAQERQSQAQALLKKSETDNSLAPQVNQLKAQVRNEAKLIAGYTYLNQLMDQSKKGYALLDKTAKNQIAKERSRLESKASQALAKQLKEMDVDMSLVLSNNEFLRYEVFAGSGENIRYQVAGGGTGAAQRIPASVKPEKSLKWSFSGEYWEDEIGSYRSSLKNNCSQMGQIPTAKSGENNI